MSEGAPINAARGEIAATINGKRYKLVLTLGALAELEAALGENIIQLADRFAKRQIGASDIVHILAAGLRGGGAEISEEEVRAMQFPRGAAEALEIASRLLSAAFAGEEDEPSGSA